jgi:hypothetical protein
MDETVPWPNRKKEVAQHIVGETPAAEESLIPAFVHVSV